MVQYDPFAPMLVDTALPTRGKAAEVTDEHAESHTPTDAHHGAAHPQLRRLSSTQDCPGHCAKCHMRRSSQDLLLTRSHSHSHSPDQEHWDGFCPDITMPTECSPRPASLHHNRRHSGLRPSDFVSEEQHNGTSTTIQMTIKSRTCAHGKSGYHHDCHCEKVTPFENLSERYGLVEEPEETVQQRRSLEHQAAEQLAEILHEELVADMEARQSKV